MCALGAEAGKHGRRRGQTKITKSEVRVGQRFKLAEPKSQTLGQSPQSTAGRKYIIIRQAGKIKVIILNEREIKGMK